MSIIQHIRVCIVQLRYELYSTGIVQLRANTDLQNAYLRHSSFRKFRLAQLSYAIEYSNYFIKQLYKFILRNRVLKTILLDNYRRAVR